MVWGDEAALKRFSLAAPAAVSSLAELDCRGWRLINSPHSEPPVGGRPHRCLPLKKKRWSPLVAAVVVARRAKRGGETGEAGVCVPSLSG